MSSESERQGEGMEVVKLEAEIASHQETCGQCLVLYHTTMYERCDVYRGLQRKLDSCRKLDESLNNPIDL